MPRYTFNSITSFAAVALFWPVAMICAQSNKSSPHNLNPAELEQLDVQPQNKSASPAKDIQCGNNFNTYPMQNATASCTNYGAVQYECDTSSCYVGNDPKQLATQELYFYNCARLGVEELLPKILAVRYKASNLAGALEIMDDNGQEYGCRWTKPTDNGNVRVSCKKCRLHKFPNPLRPQSVDL